ncbi:hypothetical protein FNV43_RR03024 [Rhamnella rubrinervis]|uniref:Receptor-like serine/threonine-protein kinase n=1 Tax=Rhamnella rubrinervis TaxID=2594499 RepID=A0A8K0HHL3_9ROSA|nr:hypothetical protein FNV43_RR03024 [Rhamnella rubrinervis]
MASFLPCTIFLISSQLPCYTNAQNINSGRVTLSQSLNAGDHKASSWLSPSGDFAFGFQQVDNDQDLFLLSIWFEKVPDKTVVWYADKNNPVPRGSKVTLTPDAGLLLSDPQGEQLWNSDPIVSQVDFAFMNDTGNIQLQNKNSENIWESFNHPTDTLLPTQTMEKGDSISSRLSGTNFSQGRFQLRLQPNGNLVLTSVNLPTEYTNENYYASATDNLTNPGKQLVFNESGNIVILRQNNQIVTLTEGKLVSSADYYYRATLNFDGVLTEYYHPKTSKGNGNKSWTALWSIPDDICINSFVYKSSGACGFNRICRLNSERRPVCECPRGFTLLDSSDEYRGCKPDFIQDCQPTETPAEKLYMFQEMTGVDWPTSDYEALQPYDEDECKDSCLNDCMCAVAIMRNDTCWKKKLPLSNGKVDNSVGAKAFIKIRKPNAETKTPESSSSSSSKNQDALVIGGSVLLGFSVFINFLLFGAMGMGFLFIYRKKSMKSSQQDKDVSRFNLRCFAFKELIDATGVSRKSLEGVLLALCTRGVEGHCTQIIHCDIKPQNILLDEFYNARISDFGLAKLLMMEQSQTNTAIRGTKGYVAPEWFRNMPITVKVDVYSFGELLLEIICCRRSVDVEMGAEEKAILAYWAYDCYREGTLDALVENDKEVMNDMKNMERFLMVAFWCIQEDPSLRPSMKKVMLMLEGIVQVSVPPSPFLFSSIA